MAPTNGLGPFAPSLFTVGTKCPEAEEGQGSRGHVDRWWRPFVLVLAYCGLRPARPPPSDGSTSTISDVSPSRGQ
jgi:hypothetical protein